MSYQYIKEAEINAIAVLESTDFDPATIYKNPRDAVAVVGGTKEEAVQYIDDKLKSITSQTYKDELHDKFYGYLSNTVGVNPEKSDANGTSGWGYVIATTTQNQSGNDSNTGASVKYLLNVKNMNEAVALTIFHGMGHLSGIKHGGMSPDNGFMLPDAGGDYRRKTKTSVIDHIDITKKDYLETMKIIYSRFNQK